MMKNYLTSFLFFCTFSVAYAQQPAKPQGLYEQLNVEQKAAFRRVHEKYREQMQELLKQSDNPVLRREKVNQLRTSRDSSLKEVLGEQLYQQYRRPVAEGARTLPGENSQSKPKAVSKPVQKSNELPEVQPSVESSAEVKTLDEPFVPKAK